MKKIYDAVHGFIRFNQVEGELIDSAPFQRLHYLHQLGIAYLVYPGATHTRFEHSLGVMELATRIFDRITAKSVFAEKEDLAYWRQIIRLAALAHDLGHLPFSHAAEKVLLGDGGHEKWTLEILQSGAFDPLFAKLREIYPGQEVKKAIIKMAIGEEKLGKEWTFSPWERVMSQVITGDFFGADRIDYLLRDAQCTGVSYGLFDYHQMIEMLCILPAEGSLELGIEENGIEACEALLLARHFMYKRVYQYSSVKAYSFHLARFMASLARGKIDLERFLALTENEILTEIRAAERDASASGHRDALALTTRGKRFKAVQLPEEVTEERLKALTKELQIPDEAIAWEMTHKKRVPVGLSFSVLTSRKKILPAARCSDILIPLGPASWVYVDPAYEEKVRQTL